MRPSTLPASLVSKDVNPLPRPWLSPARCVELDEVVAELLGDEVGWLGRDHASEQERREHQQAGLTVHVG